MNNRRDRRRCCRHHVVKDMPDGTWFKRIEVDDNPERGLVIEGPSVAAVRFIFLTFLETWVHVCRLVSVVVVAVAAAAAFH